MQKIERFSIVNQRFGSRFRAPRSEPDGVMIVAVVRPRRHVRVGTSDQHCEMQSRSAAGEVFADYVDTGFADRKLSREGASGAAMCIPPLHRAIGFDVKENVGIRSFFIADIINA
jgi:hypothetical protein